MTPKLEIMGINKTLSGDHLYNYVWVIEWIVIEYFGTHILS